MLIKLQQLGLVEVFAPQSLTRGFINDLKSLSFIYNVNIQIHTNQILVVPRIFRLYEELELGEKG